MKFYTNFDTISIVSWLEQVVHAVRMSHRIYFGVRKYSERVVKVQGIILCNRKFTTFKVCGEVENHIIIYN
jgi:hypothetical protein